MTRLMMLCTCVALMIGAGLSASDAPAATTLAGTSDDFVRPSADVVPFAVVVEPVVPVARKPLSELIRHVTADVSRGFPVIGGTSLGNGATLDADAVFDLAAIAPSPPATWVTRKLPLFAPSAAVFATGSADATVTTATPELASSAFD